jgi:hypothetical protein
VKLKPEQVELKLLGPAAMGDEAAKDLLRLMFPDLLSKDPPIRRTQRELALF